MARYVYLLPLVGVAQKGAVIQRRGDYLGKTVQVIPHVTDAVQDWIERVAKIPVDASEQEADVCIIEVRATSRLARPLVKSRL